MSIDPQEGSTLTPEAGPSTTAGADAPPAEQAATSTALAEGAQADAPSGTQAPAEGAQTDAPSDAQAPAEGAQMDAPSDALPPAEGAQTEAPSSTQAPPPTSTAPADGGGQTDAPPQKIDVSLAEGTLPMVGSPPPGDGGGETGGGDGGGGEGEGAQKIDAMICVPGIGDSPGNRFMDVAERLATAMERSAATGRAVFSVATRDATTRYGKALRSVAIRRQDTPKAEPRDVLHLYEYDYRPVLGNGLETKPPAVQATALAWTVAFSFPSILLAFRRRSKGWVQQVQVLWGGLLFGGMVLYLALLLLGTVGVIKNDGKKAPAADAAAQQNTTPPRTTPPPATQAATNRPTGGGASGARQATSTAREPWLTRARATVAGWPGTIWSTLKTIWSKLIDLVPRLPELVIVIPLAGAFLRFNIREVLSKAGPAVSTATSYLAAGQRRGDIVGGLGEMLEYLEEEGASGVDYGKVHVVAYSFGSVVAIDALFQRETEVSRRFHRIGTLITIGCPYDFVRTYWPKYFQDRYAAAAGERPRWLNVYSPLDVMGSNFIDEPTMQERKAYRAATAEQREVMRKDWDTRYGRGVELIAGGVIRPAFEDNVPFGDGQGGSASFWDWFQFIGFRAHGVYWSRESKVALNCFGPVLTRMYATEDAAGVLR
ncbi:MAG TPA: hypothetical protein VGB15_16590 [Longimicrobium sp.]|jgi:hypothetical protein